MNNIHLGYCQQEEELFASSPIQEENLEEPRTELSDKELDLLQQQAQEEKDRKMALRFLTHTLKKIKRKER